MKYLIALFLLICSCASVKDRQVIVENTRESEPLAQPTSEVQESELDVLKPLIDKWLQGERLPDRIELDDPDYWVALPVLLDLDGDGVDELSIRTGCAPVGNCMFFVYEKTSDGYRRLVAADPVQQFKLIDTRSNRYFDIETRSHGSASSGGLVVLRFNGTQYKQLECFDFEYEMIGVDGERKGLFKDVPTLSRKNCN